MILINIKINSSGHEIILRLLIKSGSDINKRNDQNDTALTVAASSSQENVVEILIENGADVNARNVFNSTALTWAAKNGKNLFFI